MTDKNTITCGECDELLSGYLEGDLDATDKARVDVHAADCLRCQSLIRDIGDLREVAGALPDLSPSRDLWQGIDARIAAPVTSIGAARQERGLSRRWLAAAAAALVVASSGVTYFATSRSVGTARVAGVSAAPGNLALPGATVQPPGGEDAIESQPVGSGTKVASENLNPPQRPGTDAVRAASGTALVARRTPVAPSASEMALAGEIGRLQMVLSQRKAQLDPATVKVVEDNLALIDRAVSQARAALESDPASGFLSERMDEALRKKLELLRTVAMLPSTT